MRDIAIIEDRVSTAAQLRMLDEGEVLEGYLDGVHGFRAKADSSRSYEHGWTTGMMDCGRLPFDQAALALRRDLERLRR